jgi:hypothetical protein
VKLRWIGNAFWSIVAAMPFKGKPSINKRNREMALRERQKDKAAKRETRAAEKQRAGDAPAASSSEEEEFKEFQRALRERAEQDAAEAERDLAGKK